MTEPKPPSPPPTLLLHDGELADVSRLLATLGTPFLERLGKPRPQDEQASWELVVATPRRLLDPDWLSLNSQSHQIAICDRDSRTLKASLRRAGVKLLVRRPVHPTVLRALLLHALYRGPEKRRNRRVSVGAPVTLRMGWHRQNALLADLSLGGCRLITSCALEPSKKVKLLVPIEVSGGKAFSLSGTVLRCIEQPSGAPAFTIKWGAMRAGSRELLKRTIEMHATGPAKLSAPAENPEAASPLEQVAQMPDGSPEQTQLSEEADRILMGREISLSGMRVDPSPLLALGSDVRLAIHAGSDEQPLVVTAKVHRDDGERGLVLRFHGLDPVATQQLSAVLDELPVIEPSGSDSSPGMIVSEILAGAV